MAGGNQQNNDDAAKALAAQEAELKKQADDLAKREAELKKQADDLAKREAELKKQIEEAGTSKKEERGAETPNFMAPEYDGPLTGDQAEKRHLAAKKAEEEKANKGKGKK